MSKLKWTLFIATLLSGPHSFAANADWKKTSSNSNGDFIGELNGSGTIKTFSRTAAKDLHRFLNEAMLPTARSPKDGESLVRSYSRTEALSSDKGWTGTKYLNVKRVARNGDLTFELDQTVELWQSSDAVYLEVDSHAVKGTGNGQYLKDVDVVINVWQDDDNASLWHFDFKKTMLVKRPDYTPGFIFRGRVKSDSLADFKSELNGKLAKFAQIMSGNVQ